jgi:hypothetical protein
MLVCTHFADYEADDEVGGSPRKWETDTPGRVFTVYC